MWFLVFFIALSAFAAGYFYGWYLAEETYQGFGFDSTGDEDRFWLDDQPKDKK